MNKESFSRIESAESLVPEDTLLNNKSPLIQKGNPMMVNRTVPFTETAEMNMAEIKQSSASLEETAKIDVSSGDLKRGGSQAKTEILVPNKSRQPQTEKLPITAQNEYFRTMIDRAKEEMRKQIAETMSGQNSKIESLQAQNAALEEKLNIMREKVAKVILNNESLENEKRLLIEIITLLYTKGINDIAIPDLDDYSDPLHDEKMAAESETIKNIKSAFLKLMSLKGKYRLFSLDNTLSSANTWRDISMVERHLNSLSGKSYLND